MSERGTVSRLLMSNIVNTHIKLVFITLTRLFMLVDIVMFNTVHEKRRIHFVLSSTVYENAGDYQ